jgi:tRNA U34 5-methylaminomethyl-2-thiouridine-forming methyltransferase MnmC
MLWGDARQNLKALPDTCQVDLILLDAFSPSRCPQLWSEEFLGGLAKRLAPGGRLLTYCRAAAVRGSLRRAGLTLRSLHPAARQRIEWSSGTLAVMPQAAAPLASEGPGWTALSAMEEEHLCTRASVPYRDPQGDDKAEIIQQRRELEQQSCGLESTSAWQRRWLMK